MKLAMMINYSGDFHADVARVQDLEQAGPRPRLGAPRPTRSTPSARSASSPPRRRRIEIGTGHHQRVLAHGDGRRPDGGRLRLRQRRPLRARARRVRPAGHRGLPRRAVRAPDAAHPRVHRRVPDGVAARAGGVRRQRRAGAAARRAGHRAGQAAQADQPPEAGRHPGVLGQPDGQERHRDGPPRRRLAADLLRPREVRARVGRRAARRSGRPRAVARAAADLGRRHGGDRRGVRRRRRRPRARHGPPAGRAVRRRDGRARPELLQLDRQALRLRRRGDRDPGPLPVRAQGGGRRRRAAGAARRHQPGRPGVASSPSASPPTARPASPTSR